MIRNLNLGNAKNKNRIRKLYSGSGNKYGYLYEGVYFSLGFYKTRKLKKRK